ncbi:hypothetical protein C2845_PM06G13610 [Panicum miliaceum]|uniref:1-phosphatidylinositol-4-phosphate 5-kinase n=1 Tax=Panicum miliaceum TaxID=4540 RepID=A0A3L6R9R7_PANMI|nr:hypothetical protein C2845_PM06G13610 [Panicum miliaceum]
MVAKPHTWPHRRPNCPLRPKGRATKKAEPGSQGAIAAAAIGAKVLAARKAAPGLASGDTERGRGRPDLAPGNQRRAAVAQKGGDRRSRQVDKDCELLEQERIMDYSLLVGIHFKDRCKDSTNADNGPPHTAAEDSEENRNTSLKLGICMPSRVENIVKNPESESLLIGELTGEFQDVFLFFGIIDILQDYDISKKLEHAYKSMQYDPNSISAVDPKQYCKRFRDFIFRAFTEEVLMKTRNCMFSLSIKIAGGMPHRSPIAETPITNAKMYAEVLTLLQLPAAYAPIRPNKFSIMAVCSAKMAGFALHTLLDQKQNHNHWRRHEGSGIAVEENLVPKNRVTGYVGSLAIIPEATGRVHGGFVSDSRCECSEQQQVFGQFFTLEISRPSNGGRTRQYVAGFFVQYAEE